MGICLVMKNNIKRSLHHKVRWIISFLLPLFLTVLVNIVSQVQQGDSRVGVLQSTNELNTETIKAIKDSDTATLMTICDSINKLDGYEAEPVSMDHYHMNLIMGDYHFIIDVSKPWSTESIISYQPEQSENEIYQSFNSALLNKEIIDTVEVEDDKLQQSIPFLMSTFLIMAVLQGGILLQDKNHGMILRYCYSPKRRFSYFLGNGGYIFSITFLQVVLSMGILCLVTSTWLGLIKAIQIVLMITVTSSLFALLLCLICKNDTQASICASAVTGIATMLGGIFIPISSMPAFLQAISKASPIRWCMELLI